MLGFATATPNLQNEYKVETLHVTSLQCLKLLLTSSSVIMRKPKTLGERELHLIRVYSNWDFSMTPIQFYTKWEVNYEQIALICCRSDSTVRGWFKQGKNRRYPNRNDLLNLALMDFLLEHFEEIPEHLRRLLFADNS
jgi:hypothetical protein